MREAFEKYAAENGYSAKRYMDFGAYEDGTVQAMWNAYHEAARAIEQLRAALEVSQSATNAAVSKAQFQASTNAELNALHDQVRKLKALACAKFNDDERDA